MLSTINNFRKWHMEIITEYWHQIIVLVGAIVVAVRLQSEVHSLRKDIEEIKKRFLNSLDAVFNSVSYIKSIEWTSTKIIEKSDDEECEDNNGEPTCGKRLFTILKKDIFLIC